MICAKTKVTSFERPGIRKEKFSRDGGVGIGEELSGEESKSILY
nr:MAG TPA: hypothetical protein [Caudoviricetes sp.]